MAVKDSLARKSAKNRMFFDNLILAIWCECKQSNRKFKAKYRGAWVEMLLPSYKSCIHGDKQHGNIAKNTRVDFATPAEILSKREIAAVQDFIDNNTFADVMDAKNKMLALFNDCQLSALNTIQPKPIHNEND